MRWKLVVEGGGGGVDDGRGGGVDGRGGGVSMVQVKKNGRFFFLFVLLVD